MSDFIDKLKEDQQRVEEIVNESEKTVYKICSRPATQEEQEQMAKDEVARLRKIIESHETTIASIEAGERKFPKYTYTIYEGEPGFEEADGIKMVMSLLPGQSFVKYPPTRKPDEVSSERNNQE